MRRKEKESRRREEEYRMRRREEESRRRHREMEESRRYREQMRSREEEYRRHRHGEEESRRRSNVRHHEEANHGEWQEPPKQRGFRRHQGNVRNPGEPVGWCLDGDDCTKGRRCMQKHTYWQHLKLTAFLETSMQARN